MTLRVVFAVTNNGSAAVKSARNLIAAAQEPIELELVCSGSGIDLALAHSCTAADVTALLTTVTGPGGSVAAAVSACANSLAGKHLDARSHPEVLVAGVTIVPAAVLRLVQQQRDGWSYLAM